MSAVDTNVVGEAAAGRSPGSAVLVAEDGRGTRLGFIHVPEEQDYYAGPCGHVGDVVVAPEAQGRGVGTGLLAAAEQWALARGYRLLSLNVFVDNSRARSVYERAGYAPETIRHVKVLSPRGGRRTRVAKTDFKSVDEYIATRPGEVQAVLQRVRRIIRKAVPGADEAISYQIPTYKLHGRAAIYFAGWKEHYSIYPANARLVAALEDDLAPYEISKGTIRFPLSRPVPVKLIGRIARLLAKEADERAKVKQAGAKKRRPPQR